MKIAVFAAYPRELSSLCKNAVHTATSRDGSCRIYQNRHMGCDIIAADTGTRPGPVEATFKHVVASYRPDAVCSIGFAGALYYRADIGELVLASRYLFLTHEGIVEMPRLPYRSLDARLFMNEKIVKTVLQRILMKEGSMVTLPGVTAKPGLKRLLPRDLPFPVSVRQSTHLAKLCCMSNLPFFSIHSITHTLDQEIPDELFHVINSGGNNALARLLAVIRTRPSLMPIGLKLSRNAGLASRNLCHAVKGLTEVLSTSHARFRGLPGNDTRFTGMRKEAGYNP